MRKWIPFALAGIVIVIYLNGAWGDFVFDDVKLIRDNRWIRSWPLVFASFNILSDRWEKEDVRPNYRPVRFLSYAIDWHITRLLFPSRTAAFEKTRSTDGGTSDSAPAASSARFPTVVFHLHNIALHAVNCIVLWVLLSRLLGSASAAALISLLWAVHPVQTESVTYLSGRRDVLFAAFYLGALVLYTGGEWSVFRLLGVSALYVLGLLTKEMAVTLPAAIFVIELFQGGRSLKRSFIRTAPLWVLACAYVAFKLLLKNPGGGAPPWGGTLGTALMTEARAVIRYLWLCFFPVDLSVDWSYAAIVPSQDFVTPWVTAPACVLVLAAVGFGIFRFLRYRDLLGLGICIFFVTLSPVMQIIPHPERFAERYLYLPLVGLLLVLSPFLRALARSKSGPVILGAVLLALCGRTMRRNRDWKDGFTLWRQAVLVNPDCARARYALGVQLVGRKAYKEAVDNLSEVFRIFKNKKPLTPLEKGYLLHARAFRAQAYASLGDRLSAELKDLPPGDPDRMTIVSKARRWYRLAVEDYKQLLSERDVDGTPIATSPRHALVHKNLAAVYFKLQQYDQAFEHFRAVLSLLPGSPHAVDARFWLGMIQIARGRITTGKTQILLAAQESGDEKAACAYKAALAELLLKIGRWEDALALYDELLPHAAGTDRKTIQYARAQIFDRLGKRNEAKWLLQEIVEEDPSFLPARISLVDLAIKEGRWEQASKELARLKEKWGPTPLIRAYEKQIAVQRALSRVERKESRLDSSKLLRLGRANLEAGNTGEAVDSFREAYLAARSEGNSERELVALRYLARALRAEGKYYEAVSVLRRALRKKPGDTRFLKDLGSLLAEKLKDFQEALVVYRKMYQKAPDGLTKIEAALAIGDLYYREGAKEEALKWYDLAAEAGSVPPEIHLRRGDICAELGNARSAQAAYETFLKSAPPGAKKRKEVERKLKLLRTTESKPKRTGSVSGDSGAGDSGKRK